MDLLIRTVQPDDAGAVARILNAGIGRRLSEATFAAARRKGYEKLFTYVRADNPAALAFYLMLGFRVVGRAERQARLRGRHVDEVIIERFLV